MATAKSQKISINQIKSLRESIESQLQSTLADDGTIDLLKLRESNQPLAEIFDVCGGHGSLDSHRGRIS